MSQRSSRAADECDPYLCAGLERLDLLYDLLGESLIGLERCDSQVAAFKRGFYRHHSADAAASDEQHSGIQRSSESRDGLCESDNVGVVADLFVLSDFDAVDRAVALSACVQSVAEVDDRHLVRDCDIESVKRREEIELIVKLLRRDIVHLVIHGLAVQREQRGVDLRGEGVSEGVS